MTKDSSIENEAAREFIEKVMDIDYKERITAEVALTLRVCIITISEQVRH